MDMGSCYVNSLAPEIAIRYQEKLQLFCDNIDPYSLDQTKCSQAVEDMPNITGHQIRSYLMLSKCPYSGRAMGDKSATLMEDYTNPQRSGWVSKICVKNRDDIAIVLGEVQILETGEFLSPWFVSFPYGYVLCAHCTCTAGINEMCIHIGGLMHRVQTLKEEARMRSGHAPAIPIPDRSVPIPERVASLTAAQDDVATKILLNFINGKKGLVGAAKPNKSLAPRGKETTKREKRKGKTDGHEDGAETVGLRKRKNRVKLYVCGICSAQFSEKDSFMSHCQKLHVLPKPGPVVVKQSIEAKLGPDHVAEKAMKQLAILMQHEETTADKVEESVPLDVSHDESEMIELIPVPDYDEDDETEMFAANCEANIDIDVVSPEKQANQEHETAVKDEEIEIAETTSIVEKPPDTLSESTEPPVEPVKMETFIITSVVDPPRSAKTWTPVVRIKRPATRSTAIINSTQKTAAAVVTRAISTRSAQKPIFVPSKPTTRSSQNLFTPIRKSLRSARKQRAS